MTGDPRRSDPRALRLGRGLCRPHPHGRGGADRGRLHARGGSRADARARARLGTAASRRVAAGRVASTGFRNERISVRKRNGGGAAAGGGRGRRRGDAGRRKRRRRRDRRGLRADRGRSADVRHRRLRQRRRLYACAAGARIRRLPRACARRDASRHVGAPRRGRGATRFGFILKGRVNDIGYQSVCVPASLRAFEEIHRSIGVLPWKEICRPAIEWARDGWLVRPAVERYWLDEGEMGRTPNPERLRFSPAGRRLTSQRAHRTKHAPHRSDGNRSRGRSSRRGDDGRARDDRDAGRHDPLRRVRRRHARHHSALLAVAGNSPLLGDDVGLPALHDVALLTLLYTTMTGWLQAFAVVGTGDVDAMEFLPYATSWFDHVVAADDPSVIAREVDRARVPRLHSLVARTERRCPAPGASGAGRHRRGQHGHRCDQPAR